MDMLIKSGLQAAKEILDEAEKVYAERYDSSDADAWMAQVDVRLARLEYAQQLTFVGNR